MSEEELERANQILQAKFCFENWVLKAFPAAKKNDTVQKIPAAKTNLEQFHCIQSRSEIHLYSGRLPNIHGIANSLVQQSDCRISGNDKPGRSMEDQSDNWYRETVRLDRGKFFRQALYRIASSAAWVVGATIKVTEMEEGEDARI